MAPTRSLLALAASLGGANACTSFVVGRGAMVDSSTIATHTNDCIQCDPRVAYIPARDHGLGARRKIMPCILAYPRYVGQDRSNTYAPVDGQSDTEPIGYMPEVEHTYAYWEANYPLINEKGLGFGESTCTAKLIGKSVQDGGNQYVSIAELMRISAERCADSRCAIKLMGRLAEEYGFYGEDPGETGAGEALSVVDGTEGWIFHISAGLKNSSAIWVAQRVPDDHVAPLANQFSIGHVNCEDEDNFLCGTDLVKTARDAGLCHFDQDADFHFTRCYGKDLRYVSYLAGVPPVPIYTALRLWRVLTLANPFVPQPVTDDVFQYPFSVKTAKKFNRTEVMDWLRDRYDDTEFDMRLGSLAGPHGNPTRLEGGEGLKTIHGNMPRAISIPRTTYGLMVQSRPESSQSMAWFAADTPATSVFVPLFAAANKVAEPYTKGRAEIFSRDSAWWSFGLVANWMNIAFGEMEKRSVGPERRKEQARVLKAVEVLDTDWRGGGEVSQARLNEVQTEIQSRLVQRWWALSERLFAEFNDGAYRTPEMNSSSISYGYPAWYLKMIGYNKWFYMPQWVQYSPFPPSLLDLHTSLSHTLAVTVQKFQLSAGVGDFAPGALLGALVAAVPAFMFGRRRGSRTNSEGYTQMA